MKRSMLLLLIAALILSPVAVAAPCYDCDYDENDMPSCLWVDNMPHTGDTCQIVRNAGCWGNPGNIGPCRPRCVLGTNGVCYNPASTPLPRRVAHASVVLAHLMTPDDRATFEAEVTATTAALPMVMRAEKVVAMYDAKARELYDALAAETSSKSVAARSVVVVQAETR